MVDSEIENKLINGIEVSLGFLIIGIGLFVAIVWIMMIHIAFKLHEAKQVGKSKESNCGEFYLEGESARASIYETYVSKDGAEDMLKVLFQFFVWIVALLVFLISLYGLVSIKPNDTSIWRSLWPPLFANGWFPKLVKIAWLTALIYILVHWITYYHMNDSNTINPFANVLFRAGETMDETEKSKLLGRQVGLLVGIAGCIGVMYYNLTQFNILDDNHTSVLKQFGTLLIIVGIFIPFLSNHIYKLNVNIRGYYEKKVVGSDPISINSDIRANLSNTVFTNNLRNNIRSLDRLPESPGTLTDEEASNPYYHKLYRYVLNGVNMAELRNIIISEELRDIIDPVHLQGENIILMKKDFLTFYNSVAISSIGTTTTSIGYYFNTYVKKYLRSDLRPKVNVDLKSKDLTCASPGGVCVGNENNPGCNYRYAECNKVIDLVKTYIINNDSYKLNNIVPINIRNKLQDLRKDTHMEDTVQSYFNSVNTISIVLFIVVSYLSFHHMYVTDPDKILTRVSLMMLVLLIIIGFFGWFFKDLWL